MKSKNSQKQKIEKKGWIVSRILPFPHSYQTFTVGKLFLMLSCSLPVLKKKLMTSTSKTCSSLFNNYGFEWCPSTIKCLIYGLHIFVVTRGVSCPIVGCGMHMNSLEDFEDHYNARHTASCSVCSRVYPTSRLLSIHVSEAHDSFFQAKAARGYAMVYDFFDSSHFLII